MKVSTMEDNQHLNRLISNKIYTTKIHLEDYIKCRTGFDVDIQINIQKK